MEILAFEIEPQNFSDLQKLSAEPIATTKDHALFLKVPEELYLELLGIKARSTVDIVDTKKGKETLKKIISFRYPGLTPGTSEKIASA